MSDIKSVIALLCKNLNLLIGSSIKAESFRLAKYNTGDEDVVQDFWTILHNLSLCAINEENIHIEYDRYDDIHATKLYFALLQYPTMDFYAISKNDKSCSRELLIAFGWLMATKKILNAVVRKKLAASVLGHECSYSEDSVSSISNVGGREKINESPSDLKFKMRNIVHTCGRVSHNMKEIVELMNEKIKLTTKIHAATLDTNGLPHLNVFQAAMTKKMFTNNGKNFTKKDEESMKELQSFGIVLETHNRWTKKAEHVFYNWMATVIEESNVNGESSTNASRCEELSNFLSLLRHVTKKKLHSRRTRETAETGESQNFEKSCVSRFFRTQEEAPEAVTWIADTTDRLNAVEDDVRAKMSRFTEELRDMLKAIPNCVEI